MTHTMVLALGIALLIAGLGLLIAVRISSPLLKSLTWLGASFASGGAGAALLLFARNLPVAFGFLAADWLLLAAFTLLHLSFAELLEGSARLSRFSFTLMLLYPAYFVWAITLGSTEQIRILVLSLLIAAQVFSTAFLLMRNHHSGLLAPVWFNQTLLMLLGSINLLRAIGAALEQGRAQTAFRFGTLTVYGLFLTAALGLAFGFLWLTIAKLTKKLEHMASIDPLTLVYNRRAFLEWCDHLSTVSVRSGVGFSLLIIDLDHFSALNNRHGHHLGDLTMISVVNAIKTSVRGFDLLGRWSGEEFVALLPGADAEAAEVIANRICLTIRDLRLEQIAGDQLGLLNKAGLEAVAPDSVPEAAPDAAQTPREQTASLITASIGLATWRGPGDTVTRIAQRAETALYQAKAAGRNRVLTAA